MRNIRLIGLHNFLCDFRPQWAFLAIYCAQITGNYTTGMAVLALERISSALLDIPTGILSDRIGRKKTIVVGSICSMLTVAIYASAHGSGMLFLGAIFYGLGDSFFSGNNDALLYESLKSEGREDRFHHYQGKTSAMFQLGLCLSALLSSVLVAGGMRFVFMAGIVPQVLSVIVSLFFEEPRVHKRESRPTWHQTKEAFAHIMKSRRLRLIGIGNMLTIGGGEANFQFITVFIQGLWPLWGLGVYRAINHALGVCGYMLSGKTYDREGPARIMTGAQIYWTASSLVALTLRNAVSPAILATNALFFGPFVVARDTILQTEFTDHQRATLGSIISFAYRAFYGLMLFLLGFAADHFGIIAAAAFGIMVDFLALPFFIALFKVPRA